MCYICYATQVNNLLWMYFMPISTSLLSIARDLCSNNDGMYCWSAFHVLGRTFCSRRKCDMHKLKNLVTVISVVVCFLLCSFLIVGCSNNEDKNNTPAHTEHNWSITYTDDGEQHYQTCDGCNEKKYSNHDYTNGKCVCGKENPNSVQAPSAKVLNVDGASIDGNKIFMLVERSVDSVSLSDKVLCSPDSVWKLYYDKIGQIEIPTKMATGLNGELLNGNNIFYIVVTSQNGEQTSLYELTVHRIYAANVNYYDGDNILKSEQVLTGNTYMVNYIPSIPGYTFDGWKSENGDKVESKFTVWRDLSLYANKIANDYIVTYNANGGDGSVAEAVATSGESLSLSSGNALSREYYTLKEFNTMADGSGIGYEPSSDISSYDFAENLTLYAIWESEFTYASSELGITITGLKNDSYSELIIPNEIDGIKVVGISENAFKNNTNLKKVAILNNVTNIGSGSFSGCNSLESITIPFVGNSVKSVTDACQYPFGYIFGTNSYIGGSATEQSYYGSSVNNLTTTVYYIPSALRSVTVLDGTVLRGAFYNCSSLTNITISDSITVVAERAFMYCSSLTSVTLPSSLTSIDDYLFWDCSSLKTIKLPDGITSIGYGAFYNCTSLTGVYISNITSWCSISFNRTHGNPLEYAHNIYVNDTLITELAIPSSIPSISDRAFMYCYSIVAVNCSVARVGASAFNSCINLMRVTIADNTLIIDEWAFANCSKLISITIGNKVSKISNCMLNSCNSLKSIIIPNSIIFVDTSAFSALDKVYYKGSAEDWKKITIKSYGNSSFINAARYYYSETVPAESGNYWHYDSDGSILEW